MSTKEDVLAALDAIREQCDAVEALVRGQESKSGAGGAKRGADRAVRAGRDAEAAGDDLLNTGSKAKGGAKARGGTGSKKPTKADVSYDDLRDKFQELLKADDGEKKAKALLKELGVEKLSKLDEDQYADAMAQAQAALDDAGGDDSGDGEGDDLFD